MCLTISKQSWYNEVKELEKVFGKLKILEVRMKASGKVEYKKIDRDRCALLIETDDSKKWYALHLQYSKVGNKEELAKRIKEDIEPGAMVDVEYVVSDKGFFNITDIEVVVDYNEGAPPEPEEEELFKEKPANYKVPTDRVTPAEKATKKTKSDDPTQNSIEKQSAYKTAYGCYGRMTAAGITAGLFSTIDAAEKWNNEHGHALAVTIAKELANK